MIDLAKKDIAAIGVESCGALVLDSPTVNIGALNDLEVEFPHLCGIRCQFHQVRQTRAARARARARAYYTSIGAHAHTTLTCCFAGRAPFHVAAQAQGVQGAAALRQARAEGLPPQGSAQEAAHG